MAESSQTPTREVLSALFDNEIILPAQFWSLPAQDERTEPERRLMLAVLENAVLVLQRSALRPSAQGERAATEVRTWIASNSRRHPFDFAAICDVLGIDAGYLRRTIAKWTGDGARRPKPRRRHAGRGRHQVRLRRRRKGR